MTLPTMPEQDKVDFTLETIPTIAIKTATKDSNVPASGLLRLPNELIFNIVSNKGLNKKDLQALRLASRELYAPVTREFAIRYVSEPFVMMSIRSLKTLVKICENSLFGPHVRKIRLATIYFGRDSRWNPRRFTVKPRAHRDLKTSWEMKDACLQAQQSEEVYIELRHGARRLLVRAIEAMIAYGTPLAFAVQTFRELEPIGRKETIEDWAWHHYKEVAEFRARTTLELIFSLAEHVGRKVESLEVDIIEDGEQPHSRDKEHTLLFPIRNIRETDPLIERLTDMKDLHFHFSGQSDRTMWGLETIAGKATKLASIELTGNRFPNNHSCVRLTGNVSGLLSAVTSKSLKRLSLNQTAAGEVELRNFLERHKNTLKTLEIKIVQLEGSWTTMITWISTQLSLTSVKLEDLYDRNNNAGGRPRTEEWLVEEVELEGRKGVREGLKELLLEEDI